MKTLVTSSSGDKLDSLLLEASDKYESMHRTTKPLPEATPPPVRTRVAHET